MELVAAFTDNEAARPSAAAARKQMPNVGETDAVAAANAVREQVAASNSPVPGSAAAARASRVVPGIAKSGWAGTGGFASFIRHHLPELTYVSTDSGGLVVDPGRHVLEAGPGEGDQPDDITARVARVTKVPPLTSAQYEVLFNELAQVAKVQPRLARIGPDVRDRAAESKAPVPRKSVDFVVTGLIYASCDPRAADVDANTLADRWLRIVLARCEEAGLALGDADANAVTNWILGGSARSTVIAP